MRLPSRDARAKRSRLSTSEWTELRAIYAKASDGADEYDFSKLVWRERESFRLLMWKRDGGPEFDRTFDNFGGIHANGKCAKNGCGCGAARALYLWERLCAGEPISKILDDYDPPPRPVGVAKPKPGLSTINDAFA